MKTNRKDFLKGGIGAVAIGFLGALGVNKVFGLDTEEVGEKVAKEGAKPFTTKALTDTNASNSYSFVTNASTTMSLSTSPYCFPVSTT